MLSRDKIFGMGKEKEFDMERFFVALSDRTRLRILNLIGREELCVCFCVEILGEAQPKISRHLAYLRESGIVASRREGKWMHYRIVPPPHEHAARILDNVLTWLKEDSEMQREREQLVRICCAPQPPVQLLGAPIPAGIVPE